MCISRLFNLDCRYPRDQLQPAREKKRTNNLISAFCPNCLIPFSSHKSCGDFQVLAKGHWTCFWAYLGVPSISRLFNLDCRCPRDQLQPAREKKIVHLGKVSKLIGWTFPSMISCSNSPRLKKEFSEEYSSKKQLVLGSVVVQKKRRLLYSFRAIAVQVSGLTKLIACQHRQDADESCPSKHFSPAPQVYQSQTYVAFVET